MTHRISLYVGDDTSPEAVRATCDVPDDLDLRVQDVSAHEAALRDWTVTDGAVESVDRAVAVLFGAASEVHLPFLYHLRFAYGGGMSGSVRPFRHLPGSARPLTAPDDLDCLLARETRQGLYFAGEGDLVDLQTATADLVGQRHATPVTDFGDGAFAARVVTEDYTRDPAALTEPLSPPGVASRRALSDLRRPDRLLPGSRRPDRPRARRRTGRRGLYHLPPGPRHGRERSRPRAVVRPSAL